MEVIRVFGHVVAAESCSIHWPGEYPPTPPPHFPQMTSKFRDTETELSVAGWASQVAK